MRDTEHPRTRLRTSLQRLWPKSLFGQLTLIMVSGTVAIQLLSSSIWFDVRFAQVLEAPVRLIASRTAPLLDTAGCDPVVTIQAPAHYQASCVQSPSTAERHKGLRRTGLLLEQALAYELGREQRVRVLSVELTDPQGQPVTWPSLFGLQTAMAHVRFAVALADGHWLQVSGQELQGWSGESAWALIADYVIRVYVLRILAVLAVCWLAVRLCLQPLRRMSDAARALGESLEQPPLRVEGPSEVRQAAHTFNAMQQRIIAMVNDQSFFLAAVSHDLRTPLTRMRLRVERMGDSPDSQRLKLNIQQMDQMIAQVLDYLESAKQHTCQIIDVDRLVRSACAELCSAEERLPISGHAGAVYANEVLLLRCIQNVLVNALRYAQQVEVRLERTEQGVLIQVDDRGPGIADSQLQVITQPFVRGDHSRNCQSGGYGLGLSIAKRIAENHQGSLLLSNRQGGGLCVRIFIAQRRADTPPIKGCAR
ncbi:ATP-binding protein [Pseudomonas sp.]|nr:ATP-binding protein [Pseudomonas sp.]